MAVCAQLAICCLLLSVASTQRVCRAVTTGVSAVCEATLGSNWTLECSLSSQYNVATLITWRLAGRNLASHNLSLILNNISYDDAGVYSCAAVNINGTFTSSLKFIVEQGRAPMLLYNNNIGGKCQNRQVVRDGVIQATVSGYPNPTVMWFRDAQRTSRIINDSIYQLLLSGDLFVKDLVDGMRQTKQVQDVLYVTVFNEFGIIHYCMYIQWIYHGNIQNYEIAGESSEVKNLVYFGLQYHWSHYGCFCKAASPTHNLQQWHLILLGLCMGYVLLLFVVVLLAVLYYNLHYQCHHYSVHVNCEEMHLEVSAKTDSDDFVYVVYSPQSEKWVEHTLMHKLGQWQLRYTTYDLSAIPGQPKIVEKLRLCSAANKIIVVLAVDSLTEDTFLNEVLQVISSEQMKVVPVLYGVSEEELQDNMIYRSIMVYVSLHHTDVNFDIRLKQALVNNLA